ncbi:hypothetical protein MTR_6g065960 [Medicago truncatula]|uniref:Putative plant transposon protein domain-containing protein n=1 Tax=Medicago truncatula TaxID=3880 RepID=A0A072UB33_MEDTR|nr:hypothetical protein MTR_6g065960 [Medicago truncatula]
MVETRNKGKSQIPTQPSKKAKTVPKRKQPVKPSPNTEPPPSVHLRFYNNAARDRFKDIRGYRVTPERGGVSFVRGKEIDYSPERINSLLEIVPPEECEVKRRMEECKDWSDERWEELLLQICVEGAKWQGGSHMLLRADFKPHAKAWASFVVQTLEGTSCTSEIPLARLLTVFAILDGAPINVGELIANNIYMFASAAAGQPEPQPRQRRQPQPRPPQSVHGEGSSQQEYWNHPRSGKEFTEAVCLNRRPMTGSFERFDGSEEAMDHYFDVTRIRAQDIRLDFAAGSRQSRHHFGEDSFPEENPATWIPEDQMQD